MNPLTINFKPAVSTKWLIASAGLMWSIVGIMLCRLAFQWLIVVSGLQEAIYGAIGLAAAVVIYYFGFSRIAKKNIYRVSLYKGKTCFFAFQEWKSYIIIMVMIGFGILLRHSSIHKYYLAVVYIAIGGALFLSSFHYYAYLWQLIIDKKSCK